MHRRHKGDIPLYSRWHECFDSIWTLKMVCPKQELMSYYITLVRRLLICLCSIVQCVKIPPMFRGIWKQYSYHNICRLIPDFLRRISCEGRNIIRNNSRTHMMDLNLHQFTRAYYIIYFVPSFDIYKQNYIRVNSWCDIIKHQFLTITSSTFISDVYGLMWRILYLIFSMPYCNVTMPLVQHCAISNGPIYGVSYFKVSFWFIMTLYLT